MILVKKFKTLFDLIGDGGVLTLGLCDIQQLYRIDVIDLQFPRWSNGRTGLSEKWFLWYPEGNRFHD